MPFMPVYSSMLTPSAELADEVDEAGEAAPAFIVADGLQGDIAFFGEPAAADVLRDTHGAHIAANLAGVNLEHG